jgi:hypothetical protein
MLQKLHPDVDLHYELHWDLMQLVHMLSAIKGSVACGS